MAPKGDPAATGVLAAIRDALHDASLDDVKGADLADGHAGLALFHAYAHGASGAPDDAARAREHLHRAFALVAETATAPELFSGFVGVAWVAEHLRRTGLQSLDDDALAGIDDAILGFVDVDYPSDAPFDLVRGLVGVGVYALEREEALGSPRMLEATFDALARCATRTPDGATWLARPEWLDASDRGPRTAPYSDLGLAHGVAGVVSLLAMLCERGVRAPESRALLDDAVRALLARQVRDGSRPYAFPGMVLHDGRTPNDQRVAWCYGDLGVASALFAAARATGSVAWRRLAVEVAHGALGRPREGWGVVDGGLCHGAAGLAQVAWRAGKASDDPRFADAAASALALLDELRSQGAACAGFSSMTPDANRTELAPTPERGFLTGIAGIGLALLTFSADFEPAWDCALLLSTPGGARRARP